jgi:hypothetical protein
LSLYIFIFLLVLDIVLGDICHIHFMFVGLFWKISIGKIKMYKDNIQNK